jgi:hypothetical protein
MKYKKWKLIQFAVHWLSKSLNVPYVSCLETQIHKWTALHKYKLFFTCFLLALCHKQQESSTRSHEAFFPTSKIVGLTDIALSLLHLGTSKLPVNNDGKIQSIKHRLVNTMTKGLKIHYQEMMNQPASQRKNQHKFII